MRCRIFQNFLISSYKVIVLILQYNSNFRLRNLPKFLRGGFENWRLYYPMHTSTKSAMSRKFVDIANRTEFARAVAEYKKGFTLSPEFLAC